MKMHSPIVAMLWENWRLTRVEAAQRLGMGIVAGSAALTLFDASPTVVFWILIALHACFYFSIAKLNGGRFIDGYKPGFPLYLLYTRPVSTAKLIGVAMAYDAISCTALFVVSAALLGFAFDQPLPSFSVAVLLLAFHLACLAVQWSTRNRVIQWTGSIAIGGPFFVLLVERVKSSPQVEFSLAENALMALVGVVSYGLAVAGVARQRRGDSIARVPRSGGSAGYPDWLITLFRFRCPTSSPTRAQVWFELKSSGLPVLALGLVLAMLLPLLFAIGIAVVPARLAAASGAVFSVPIVLLFLGGNAFGIRRKQGRTYASSFEATQPYGTAQLAGLKVLVRSGCVLAALIAVGVSLWTSTSFLSAWGGWVDGSQGPLLGLLKLRRDIGDAFGTLTGYTLAVQVIVTMIGVAVLVAALATFEAIRARYPRRVLVGGSLLLLYVLALVLYAWAAKRGIGSEFLLEAMLRETRWIVVAAVVFGAVYVTSCAFAERLLTGLQACGVVLVLAAFGAAWLTLLRAAGVSLEGMTAAKAVWMLSPALLLLMFSVLAPWSLSRIRHV